MGDIIRIIPIATEMMPWVHIKKEWEVIAKEDYLSLVGKLCPRLFLNLTFISGKLKISLHDLDPLDNTTLTFFDRMVSTQEADIVGGLSMMLNAYAHHVSIGTPRLFKPYFLKGSFGFRLEEVLEAMVTFHSGVYWVSPTEISFYSVDHKKWFHHNDITTIKRLIKGFNLIEDFEKTKSFSQPLPPE